MDTLGAQLNLLAEVVTVKLDIMMWLASVKLNVASYTFSVDRGITLASD